MTLPITPLRGDVWDAGIPRIGAHPVVVLAANLLIPRLSAVHCVLVTGQSGPPSLRIPLDASTGLTRYDESYADATTLLTLPRGALQRRRGRLARIELERIEEAVRMVLGML